MKKLINAPSRYVDEALEGMCLAFPGYRKSGRVISRGAGPAKSKVGVVTGGGFGHLPVFAGYVGHGMLSSCAVGEVFAGPPVDVCGQAIRAADGGAGVVCVLGNYGGDRMSFAQACEDFEDDGGKTSTVIVADDVASASSDERAKRRGVAGMVFAFKTAGAAADGGASMDEVARIAKHTADRTRSIGVALSPCLIPGAAAPGFSVEEGQMELGMGIHGEPGVERRKIGSADDVASALVDRLLKDRSANGGKVAVLVNSLGATPLEELLILYRKVDELLSKARLEIVQHYVGHYATSMEMAGASISIVDLDAEIERLLKEPTACPFWPR
jgi:dihydroxyacetone kinase-like protein